VKSTLGLTLCLLLLAPRARAEDAGDAGVAEEVVAPSAHCPSTPEYPTSEKASGVRGVVTLRVTLSETGAVTALEVSKGLGPAFDAAALASARACTFTHASRGGVAAPAIIELAVEFTPPVEPWILAGEVVGELGQALPGAEIRFGGKQTTTDAAGRFELQFEALPPGDAWVLVSKEGFADKGFPEVFAAGRTTRVRYVLQKEKLRETRIEGSRLLPALPDVDHTPQVSRFTITRADIERNPGAMEDVTRVVQQVPGVGADPDLLATFFVRGGGPEEVVFYLDGVPLTNPYHLGGFASIFNPMMIETADFYAGGIPARYEPALSGAFEVRYATGETKKPRVWADLSMLTAKIRADVPLGLEGLSATVSFRRSYFEAYFAVLKAAHVFGTNVVAPDITEVLARVNYTRGQHTTTASFIYAADGLDFVIRPGEQVLVNFAGGLKISNAAEIAILQHKIDLAGDTGLEFTGAYTRDANSISVSGDQQQSFANKASHEDLLARADFKWAHSETNRTGLGAQFAHRFLGLEGKVADSRGVAPWINEPFVDTFPNYLPIAPNVRRNLLSIYAEHTWRPTAAFSLEGGGRGQLDVSASQWSYSARLAAAVTLPTATVLKASAGVAAQPSLIPITLDPMVGNPKLKPERSFTGIFGIEQPLPFEALVRLEGWVKALDQLIVNPDTDQGVAELVNAGAPVFQNVGTGFARGVDLLFLGRSRYFAYGASAALLFSDRHNPLAAGSQDYPAPWDQRFTLAAHLSWSPNNKWLFTGRFNFRTGRPYTPVVGFVRDELNARYLPVFGDTNSSRYPGFYEFSLRAERRFRLGPLDMAAYLEVLNLTNSQNLFARLYSSTPQSASYEGDFAAGLEPQSGNFNHLPIRPFLGVRAEY
jgi:TonB family protein